MLEIYSSNLTIEANNAMFCFDPNPLCNGGIHTQHQFSPAISRNLIVDFGYFHWTLLCPTNFLAEREKCFQNTKKEWGNFFEWSKSRQTTHNRFLCITVSLEKKITYILKYCCVSYIKGLFQILSCTYVPFENPKIEFFPFRLEVSPCENLRQKLHQYTNIEESDE